MHERLLVHEGEHVQVCKGVFLSMCIRDCVCSKVSCACVRHGARTQKEKEVGGGEARTRKEISVCQVKLKD